MPVFPVATKGLGTALGAAALVMVEVMAGYVLLLVPGIVFGVMAAFTMIAQVHGFRQLTGRPVQPARTVPPVRGVLIRAVLPGSPVACPR